MQLQQLDASQSGYISAGPRKCHNTILSPTMSPPPLATGALTLLTEGVATSYLHAGTAVSLRPPLRSTCQESCFTQSPPCSTCRESCFPQTPRPIYMPGELFPSAPRLIYMPEELFPSGPPPRSTCRVGCFFYFLCFFYYAL